MQYFEISGALVFKVTGKDSTRYLNARLSNDIRNLQPGSVCAAAALNPQGRCEGYFRVYRLSEQEFVLACDGGGKEEVLSALKRYIVADRVTVEDLSSKLTLCHLLFEDREWEKINRTFALNLESSADLKRSNRCISTSLGLASASLRSREIGLDTLLEDGGHNQVKLLGAAKLEIEPVEFLRFEAGIPAFPSELRDLSIIEADLGAAISSSKGCYVGQEVVERSTALGRPPRLLRVFEIAGKSLPNPGDNLTALGGGATAGRIVSVCRNPNASRILAFISVKNTPEIVEAVNAAGLEIDGQKALPLVKM